VQHAIRNARGLGHQGANQILAQQVKQNLYFSGVTRRFIQ
jgi:hypothetical protein